MRCISSKLVCVLFFAVFIWTPPVVRSQKFDSIRADEEYGALSSKSRQSFILNLCEEKFTNPDEADTWILMKLKNWDDLAESLSQSELYDLMVGLGETRFMNSSRFLAHRIISLKKSKSDSNKLQAFASHALVNYHNDYHRMDSSAYYLERMQSYLDSNSDSVLWAGFFSNQGFLKSNRGDYFGAIVSYQNALDYLISSDVQNMGVVYQNMALAYKSLKYYEKAEFYMERALRLISKGEALINALSSLAIIKMHLAKLDDSEKIHRFVLSQEKRQGNELIMARTYTNLANVKRRKKEFGLALRSIDSSDALCVRLQMNIGLSINKINRAEILADSGLPQKALPFLQSAEVDFQSIPSAELSMEVSRLLARVYDQLGNKGRSDAYFRKYITLRDSLLGDDRKTAIVEWELAKERAFNASKNAELNAALLRQKFQKQNILLLTGFLAALLLAVILVLRRRQERIREKSRREKERLEFELELKSKELVAESMKALSVDQAKEGIYEKLHTLVGGLPKTHQAVFGGLFNELRRKEDDTNWEEFESRFLGVYEDFFAKLKEMAPDITPAEVRVCALMRLNMSTKEIARLSGRTQGTVDNNRSRIRKKLRLTEEDNLYDFLSKL